MKWIVVFSIIFVGNLPATITAATTDGFLTLFDLSALFLGWMIAFTVLDCWNDREIKTRILTPDEVRELFKH